MKIYATATEAIEHSIGYNEVAFSQNTPENINYLRAECDDSVDAGEVLEFWTDDKDSGGMQWRVHIRR